MRWSLAGLVTAVAIGAAVAGCTDQGGNVYLHFSNQTSEPIEVILINPATGSEYVMEPEIKAGTTSVTRSDVYPGSPCSDRGILVARDAQGIEIARRTGQICKGDTWVIGGSPSNSPS
jgi:hypothetical protein